MRRLLLVLVVGLVAGVVPARAAPVCSTTPRPDPSNPFLVFQRQAFGFHDEELILCSDGVSAPAHLAARMWVPAACVEPGSCPAVLIAHGFGFNKEITFGDMLNAAQRGMVVLSYDVRGQGASGGQATLLGPDDVADQSAVLAWMHERLAPTKLGVYGISQGGALAFMAAIYNCGAARAAAPGSTTSCDEGGRWVDAIAPLQAPVSLGSFGDGTCLLFAAQAVPYSRGNAAIAAENARCLSAGLPIEQTVGEVTDPFVGFDLSFRDLLPRAHLIDVPAYIGTSFNDRLVPPQEIADMYQALGARADYDEDLRFIVSSDGHGDIGANFAVLDDIFGWLAVQLGTSDEALRAAPVAIAQEWDGDSFRLEHAWPIPDTVPRVAYLARGATDPEANGTLLDAPRAGEPADELRNVPVMDSPPEAPFLGGARLASDQGTAGVRLVYRTSAYDVLEEITGVPEVTLWVSSTGSDARGQVHVSLHEVTPDGEASEFARARRTLTGLGAEPAEVRLRFNAVARRIDRGNRLMLAITPSDVGVALPAWSLDSIQIHHDVEHPSALHLPIAPAARTPPDGDPPAGASFLDDPVGTICEFFSAPCP